MSGSRARRTIVLALVLTAGSLPASSAWAAQASRTGREATVRQEGVFRTWMDNAWSLLRSVLDKEPYASDKEGGVSAQNDSDLGEGSTICPLGGGCRPPY